MGKATGFLEFERADRGYIKPEERLKNYKEYVTPLPGAELTKQAARCMNCGIPYCHNGCPVNNMIPDWNDLVYRCLSYTSPSPRDRTSSRMPSSA